MGGHATAGVPMHQQSVDDPWKHSVGAIGRPRGRYFMLKGEISPVACRLLGDTKPQCTPSASYPLDRHGCCTNTAANFLMPSRGTGHAAGKSGKSHAAT